MGRLEDAAAETVARNEAATARLRDEESRAAQESRELRDEFLQVVQARNIPPEITYRMHANFTRSVGSRSTHTTQSNTRYELTGVNGWIVGFNYDDYESAGTLVTPSGEFWQYSYDVIYPSREKPQSSYFYERYGTLTGERVVLLGKRLDTFTSSPNEWAFALQLYFSFSSK